MSRFELLQWVNGEVQIRHANIENLCSGVAYCKMMSNLFPNSINQKRVKINARQKHEYEGNLKLLQAALNKLKVDKTVPIESLILGRFKHNFEFLQWFKKFYESKMKKQTIDINTEAAVMNMPESSTGPDPRTKRIQARCIAAAETQPSEEARMPRSTTQNREPTVPKEQLICIDNEAAIMEMPESPTGPDPRTKPIQARCIAAAETQPSEEARMQNREPTLPKEQLTILMEMSESPTSSFIAEEENPMELPKPKFQGTKLLEMQMMIQSAIDVRDKCFEKVFLIKKLINDEIADRPEEICQRIQAVIMAPLEVDGGVPAFPAYPE